MPSGQQNLPHFLHILRGFKLIKNTGEYTLKLKFKYSLCHLGEILSVWL